MLFFNTLEQFGQRTAIKIRLTAELKATLQVTTPLTIDAAGGESTVDCVLYKKVTINGVVTKLSSSVEVIEFSYQAIAAACEAWQHLCNFDSKAALGFIIARNDLPTIVAYLACLRMGCPVMLIDAEINTARLQRLHLLYRPSFIVSDNHVEWYHQPATSLDKDLALLLSTSGSTGSPKQVALSSLNLQANASSISEFLPIRPTDTALTTLPFCYSYGLSIINSHLLLGASLFLSDVSVVDKTFWQLLDCAGISSFGGVPHSYDMLIRLGLTQKALPSLRYFTQAGGKLAPKKVGVLTAYANSTSKSFYVMYGQTEATARMAYADLGQLQHKPETIGKAIPNGQLVLRDDSNCDICLPNQPGELCYIGPNVMLGYACNAEDLRLLPRPSSLATGDLAYRDADGDFFITGRLSRLVKVFGVRVALDEVESLLKSRHIESCVVGKDNQIQVLIRMASLTTDSIPECTVAENSPVVALISWLSAQLQIHHSAIKVKTTQQLPITTNGKADYVAARKHF